MNSMRSLIPLTTGLAISFFAPPSKAAIIYDSGLAEDGANSGASFNTLAPPATLNPKTFYDFRNLPASPNATLTAEGWATLGYGLSGGAAPEISASGSAGAGYNGAFGPGGHIYGQGFNDIGITFTLTSAYTYTSTASTTLFGGAVTGISNGSGLLLPGTYTISGSSIGGFNTGTDGFSFDLKLSAIPPSSLWTLQQKSFFTDAATVAGNDGLAFGILNFGNDLAQRATALEKSLDALGVALGFPQANKVFSTQVLDSTNLELGTIGVALGCAAAKSPTACEIAWVGLDLEVFRQYAAAIAADPTDPDYRTVFVPSIDTPPAPFTTGCSGLATVSAESPYILDQTDEWVDALYVTNNRYQTALAAGDMTSVNLQASTFASYLSSYNSTARTAQAILGCFASLLPASGLDLGPPTANDEASALNFLQTADLSDLDNTLASFGITAQAINTIVADTSSNSPTLPDETAADALNNEAHNLTTAAPEPGSLALFMSGISALSARLLLLRSIRDRRRVAGGKECAIIPAPVAGHAPRRDKRDRRI
jgi:hypothetical protein